jgi:nucleotide-binding universal stress UspA family protein
MTGTRISRIVVGYDYSPIADLALERAFDLGSKEEHAEIHVVTVVLMGEAYGGMASVPMQPVVSFEDSHEMLENRATQLADEWKERTGRGFDRLITHVRSEAPAVEIAQLAADLEAQLIVVGTHGRRGVPRFLLGSVAEGVVRMAPCEVLVVRPRDDQADAPKIEPPCPRCVEERKRTAGAEFWCEQHRERHGQRHTYHYVSRLNNGGNVRSL